MAPSPRTVKEAAELLEWAGSASTLPSDSPGVAGHAHRIFSRGPLLLALGAAVMATLPFLVDEAGLAMGLFIGGPCALIGMVRLLLDYRTLARIRRGSAPELLRTYYQSIGGSPWLATKGLASHPEGVLRAEHVGMLWDQCLSSGSDLSRITHVATGTPEPLGQDICVVPARFTIVTHAATALTFAGLIGRIASETSTEEEVRKLLVRHSGRWYLVNGEPGDETDRNLAEEIRRTTK